MTSEEFICNKPIFSSKTFAHALGLRHDSASRKLNALFQEGFLKKAGRGIWFNPQHEKFSALALVPFILGAEQSYAS